MTLCVHCSADLPAHSALCPTCGRRTGRLLWSPPAQSLLMIGAIANVLLVGLLATVLINNLSMGLTIQSVAVALAILHVLAMTVLLLRAHAAVPP